MRRALSITIALLFGLSLAAPLFTVDAASSLPQCCRRNGSHHCAAEMTSDSASRAVSTIAPKCPSWPKSTAASWRSDLASPQSQAVATQLYAHPESAPQTQARYRMAFARSRQKRGPPVNFPLTISTAFSACSNDAFPRELVPMLDGVTPVTRRSVLPCANTYSCSRSYSSSH